MFRERTAEAAKGKWRGILSELGVPDALLGWQACRLPLLTSRDNFRFDNKEGSGSWICTCGHGRGMDFAIRFTRQPFNVVAPRIDAILGNVTPDSLAKRDMTDEQCRAAVLEVWRAATLPAPGDLLHRYLASRGLGDEAPLEVRLHPALKDRGGGVRPCMVARVSDAVGNGVTLHGRS